MSMRQIGWVVLGLLSALGLGFILGLARPHPQAHEVFESDARPFENRPGPFGDVRSTDEA